MSRIIQLSGHLQSIQLYRLHIHSMYLKIAKELLAAFKKKHATLNPTLAVESFLGKVEAKASREPLAPHTTNFCCCSASAYERAS